MNLRIPENLILPDPTQPGGNYVPVNIRDNMIFVAIQFPILNGVPLYMGRLGCTLDTLKGYKAARLCALNVLAQLDAHQLLDKDITVNHIDIHYRATDSWDEAPHVADGASDIFYKLLGNQGAHSRSIVGVNHLPNGFCLGLTSSFTYMRS